MSKELDAIALQLTGDLGYEVVPLDLQDPQLLTMAMYAALQRYVQKLEIEVAGGQDAQPGFNATLVEVNRLLSESPWTVHPDYGVMRSAAVAGIELDQVNLQFIARNVDRMNAGVPDSQVAGIVNDDITAFCKIGDGALQRHAAEEMSHSIEDHAAYKTAFMEASARNPGLVDQMSALNALTKSLVSAKEDRKAMENLVERGGTELHSALVTICHLALPVKEPVTRGLHIGRIVAVEGQMAGQQIGRDPDKVVWHDLTKLAGPRPVLGEPAEISYVDGWGTAKDLQQERSGNGVGR